MPRPVGRPRLSEFCDTCRGAGALGGCPECDTKREVRDSEPCQRCWLTTCDCED